MITASSVLTKMSALILSLQLVAAKTSLNLFAILLLANGVMISKVALFLKTKTANVIIFVVKIPVLSTPTTSVNTVETSILVSQWTNSVSALPSYQQLVKLIRTTNVPIALTKTSVFLPKMFLSINVLV